jgi:hypothetical protein
MKPMVLLVVAAVLAACAESGSSEKILPASELPPVSGAEPAVVPSPAIAPPPAPLPPATTAAPSRQDIPEQPGWANPEVPLSAHQRDIEACYDYAWAQVERDLQIDSDIQDTMDTMASGLGFSPENRQANLYGARQRRHRLFERCMQSRGYQAT